MGGAFVKKLFYLLIMSLFSVTIEINAEVVKTTVFNQEQTHQIQKIVHDYVVNHPEIIIEAGKKLQEQEKTKEEAQLKTIKKNIEKYKKELFDTKTAGRVVTGNLDGKIVMVEFTQQQCSHCKAVTPIVDQLLRSNPEVQFITVYWPFFGEDAIYASKAAIAAQKQGKFEALKQAMNISRDFLNREKIDQIILTIPGIDAKKMHVDMNANDLNNGIKANFKLAHDLGLMGTPTFIFANKEMTKFSFIPGQTEKIEDDLKKALNEVR